MAEPKDLSLPDFAQAVVEATRGLKAYEATQTVEAGRIRLTARIASSRPDRLMVEYESYENPLLELEERLTGDAEYTADELIGLSLHLEGKETWLHDPSTHVCLVKPSRALFEPFPEFAVLGTLECLWDLPHDYLLRDLEPETIGGREARILALKPKHEHRTHLFKHVSFLTRKAIVAFDPETLFPIRLRFSPLATSETHRMLGPEGQITVRYTDVRLGAEPRPSFSPPDDARVFREKWLTIDELAGQLPFSLTIAPLIEAGYESLGGRVRVTSCAEQERAYIVASFFSRSDEKDGADMQIVSLRAGNYMSRNMARRKVTIAEVGEDEAIGSQNARYLDRRALWEEHASGIDPSQAPCELAWERDGIFWFLSGIGVGRSDLVRLAGDLLDEAPPA